MIETFNEEDVLELISEMKDLEHDNKELKYRLQQCIGLLKTAKCPQGCTGKCPWCYEREVEVRPHANEK